MDIREMLRHLQRNQSDRTVARAMGVNRKTVARYRAWAAGLGSTAGPLLLEKRPISHIPGRPSRPYGFRRGAGGSLHRNC